ncbi:MAG: carbohydrate ABC transporter permease [Clostridia bacterium]|nr:carbohydrate ABC transporter permease [Clostridia bacterium]
MKKRFSWGKVLIHVFFILFSLTFILPILSVLSVSLTDESVITQAGYSLIPKKFSTLAYSYIFSNPKKIIDGYAVTIFIASVGTVLSLLVTTSVAYALSRKNFAYRKFVTYYIFFTMLFSGGLVPSYILITQYLHLTNNIWVYILPGTISAWNVIVVRTFMQGIPDALVESAKIDGASEYRIYLQIIIPLSKPVLATIGLLTMLANWNSWQPSMLYIRPTHSHLYTLQYLLQRMLLDAQFAQDMANLAPGSLAMSEAVEVPSEGMRFAMCVLAAGPMLVVFPFFQKYFSKGLTVGAVKG